VEKSTSGSLEERILEKIVRSLKSGEKLPSEKQLASEFGVSRAAIREAFSAFEASGVVVALQGSGRYVQMPDVSGQITDGWTILIRAKPELLLELLEIRVVLEIGFLPKAIDRLSLDHIAKLKQLVETMLEKSAKGENYVREDREFHRILFASTGNPLLGQLLKAFWDLYEQSNIVKDHANLQAVARTHQQMLEAIVRKNVDQAISLMNQQFADVRYHVSMLLAANAEPDLEGGDL